MSIYTKVFEKRWRSQKGHVTSHQGQSIKNRRGTHGPPVPQIWCNSDYYLQSYGILKNMAHVIYLWSAAILKVSVEPYRFSNIPQPQVKNGRPKKFQSDSGLFYRVIVLTSQDAIFVPGQRSNVT